MQDLNKYIVNVALKEGFAACGVTDAGPCEGAPFLKEAESEGRFGAMKWLARNIEGRADPKSLLEGAESVICCALKYDDSGSGSRARFARGEDYHEIVREKLASLWRKILKMHPRAKSKLCVDTSPVLEKGLAQRAGIGWIGKHTVLLNKELGSWFVLGEIITDLKIGCNIPAKNMCGECRACVDSCPTRAIVAPHKLDARRCISYLTIEHKGAIDKKFEILIDKNTYGCDICQEACPHNGRAYSEFLSRNLLFPLT